MSMAVEIIEALDDEAVDTLVEKTITSGRSIGTLPFTLRELKLYEPSALHTLERKIGVRRWWKLILANGKINGLAPLMNYMGRPFRLEMQQASTQITTAEWQALLMRGDLGDLAIFARVGEPHSPKLFTPALIRRLSPTFEKLVHAADWSSLASCAYRLSEAPDSQLKDHLHVLLDERLAGTDIASLRFDTFEEAAVCIGALWRMVPSKRDELVQSLFNILPEEGYWYRDASFLRAACGLLFFLAVSQSHPDGDRRMLELCNNRNVVELLGRAESRDIMFYLWNLYSLWLKCEKVVKKTEGATFAAFLDPGIRDRVKRILDKRLRSQTNALEKERLVSLCGFLYASGLGNFSKEDKAAWSSGLPSFEELLAKAKGGKSFLVASFYLIGLGLIFDRERDIPKDAFAWALSNAGSYEERTDAFSNLCRLLRTRAR
jgi:hypothetical protein